MTVHQALDEELPHGVSNPIYLLTDAAKNEPEPAVRKVDIVAVEVVWVMIIMVVRMVVVTMFTGMTWGEN